MSSATSIILYCTFELQKNKAGVLHPYMQQENYKMKWLYMDLPYKQSSSVHSSWKNCLYSKAVYNALLSIFDQFLNK